MAKHDRVADVRPDKVRHLELQFALAKEGRTYDDTFLQEGHGRWLDFGCRGGKGRGRPTEASGDREASFWTVWTLPLEGEFL